jgi:hypothetical protein
MIPSTPTILWGHMELFLRRNWRSIYGDINSLRAELRKFSDPTFVITEECLRQILPEENDRIELLSRIRTHPKYIQISITAGVNLPVFPAPHARLFSSAPLF